ncbi:glycerophosphodiester phosphodiesterase [Haploplasma axanthum]|uniref:Glycerophosphoryl diester phosphodiesterase n=1 Tax=Haploplasma axanthum TaxID=29552 RepID=A0A449BFN6_HAPAX|nr:glycerophosphodiester phosphodiesterase [Haploplasma axanthum]VEU81246.1 Glycerophosphoryl diester phosphodiesterase precursor [Haploplasma axanthum]
MQSKINIFNVIKDSLKLIKKNFWGYIITIIGIEALALFVMNEFGKRVFNIALLTANVGGITNKNFTVIFKNPITIFLLLTIIVISAIFVVLQITITNYYASRDYSKEKTNIKTPFKALKKIKPAHLLVLIIYIFLIMPNGNLGVASGLTAKIHLPRFIVDSIFENTFYTIVYISGIILSFYLNLRFFYTFAIFTNEDLSFIESMKKSWQLTKQNLLKILLLVLIITLLSLLFILLSYGINYGLYSILSSLFPKHSNIIRSTLQELFVFTYVIILSASTIFLIQITVVSYHQIEAKNIIFTSSNFVTPIKKMVTISLSLLIFLSLTIIIHNNQKNPNLSGEIMIVSHRGESVYAIENTLDSLRIANTHNPSYVEIDIQQTKDNEIVVFHDSTLRRLANRANTIKSLTLAELKNITLRHNGYESKIASFDEYLSLAKELNQPLLIEIKTTNQDSITFMNDIITKIEALDMMEMVIFQSLDLNFIIKFKEQYPNITTGYIIGFTLGSLENYNVNFFSIESSSITARILSDIERYNKSLFIWTVNDRARMQTYIQSNIAGIITDYPGMANTIKKEFERNHFNRVFWRLDFKFY